MNSPERPTFSTDSLVPPPAHPLKYRPDIDGLRAGAVLSVVLFHLGLPLHGGFVGVDIFFTISGYLIGSIILKGNRDHTFTFGGFYERRIRRIFPALFVMLLAVAAIAYRYLLPSELDDFARSLGAAVLSASNFLFWSQSGYFDAPAAAKPLLHTWSLAVEEQFYIFFPIALFVLRRAAAKRISGFVYGFAVLSFAAAAYGAYAYPTATFYSPLTRAWELLIGAVMALEGFPTVRSRRAREISGLTGAALVVASLFLLTPATPFPGLAALPACLGTALVIAAGARGTHTVGQALAFRPIVFIGLISYSLYLWHWPVIVFNAYGFVLLDGLTKHQGQLAMFATAIALAVLSWRFVEMPFRSARFRLSRKWLFSVAAGVSVVAGVWSVSVVLSGGAPERFPPEALDLARWLTTDPLDSRDQYRAGKCFATSGSSGEGFDRALCLNATEGKRSVVVLGDSHAAALWWGLDQVLTDTTVMQATASGCKPVLKQRPRQLTRCIDVMNYVLDDYLATHHVDAVVIEAHWDDGDLESLGQTLVALKKRGVPVVLVGPMVQYDSPLPRLLAYSLVRGDPQLPRRHLLEPMRLLDGKMSQLAKTEWKVPYVSLFDLTCKPDGCLEYAAPNVPLLIDYGHLSKLGSVLVANRFPKAVLFPAP